MARRIYLDVTMAARSGSIADGFLRVIRELGRDCLPRPDADFVVFDPHEGGFRSVERRWWEGLVAGEVILALDAFDPRRRPATGLRRWMRRPRDQAVLMLETWRLNGGMLADLAATWQQKLMSAGQRRLLHGPGGQRRKLVRRADALGARMTLGRDDVLLLCGSDWPAMAAFLAERRSGDPGHVVVFCQDIIPILFPQFFLPATARSFAACFEQVFRVADLVVFTTRKIEDDARRHCSDHGGQLPDTAIVPLGSSPSISSRGLPSAPLRDGLAPDRYILFVSTIEPRKGHAMLLDVWTRLAQTAPVRDGGWKMVFVGGKGWLVDDLYARFGREPFVGKSLLVLSGIDDAELAALYGNAAFCVYPSIYEGFGLPVIEAFRNGKAVIVSSGGALPEVAGDLAPCLDPADRDAWTARIQAWMENPAERQDYERRIRALGHFRSWSEMSADFLAEIDRRWPDAS